MLIPRLPEGLVDTSSLEGLQDIRMPDGASEDVERGGELSEYQARYVYVYVPDTVFTFLRIILRFFEKFQV